MVELEQCNITFNKLNAIINKHKKVITSIMKKENNYLIILISLVSFDDLIL